MIKRITFILSIILVVVGCRKNTIDCDHEQESWKAIDIPIDENCNFYMMYMLSGENMFRISSSGKCQSLTKEVYINKYQNLLTEHGNEIPIRSGKIIFESHSFNGDSMFVNKLINVTNTYFKTKSRIVENGQKSLTIEIYQ
ncbi:hypothetical protein [Flavobacterium sp.]|uniref:hypothetical protein n=1 Tax=Flavobacterium sp. TaxID=239 RepID=UPI00391C49A6